MRKEKAERSNRKMLDSAFPVEYVRNGLNATKAYKALKTNATYNTARVEGSALLAKPDIRARILALLPSEDIEAGVIRDALGTPIKREMNWTEKHKYLETSLKLKGLLNNTQDKPSVNVGIIIES